MNALIPDCFYFLPQSKGIADENTKWLYFDEKCQRVSISPEKTSSYAVAVRVIDSHDFGEKLPLTDRNKKVTKSIHESIPGYVIQFSGKIHHVESMKDVEESAKEEILKQLNSRFAVVRAANVFQKFILKCNWSIESPRASQVQFTPKTPDNRSDSAKYRMEAKYSPRKPKLQTGDHLWNLVAQELRTKMGRYSSKKTSEFVNFIIFTTLNDLSRQIVEEKISREEAISQLDHLLIQHISTRIERAESILYEEFLELQKDIEKLDLPIENIEFLENSLKTGNWTKGKSKTMLYKELTKVEAYYVGQVFPGILKSPTISQAIITYLTEQTTPP